MQYEDAGWAKVAAAIIATAAEGWRTYPRPLRRRCRGVFGSALESLASGDFSADASASTELALGPSHDGAVKAAFFFGRVGGVALP